jgi:hypothetical protein
MGSVLVGVAHWGCRGQQDCWLGSARRVKPRLRDRHAFVESCPGCNREWMPALSPQDAPDAQSRDRCTAAESRHLRSRVSGARDQVAVVVGHRPANPRHGAPSHRCPSRTPAAQPGRLPVHALKRKLGSDNHCRNRTAQPMLQAALSARCGGIREKTGPDR